MQKKSKGRKSYPLKSKEVADIMGVSESIVKKVRTAKNSGVSLTTNNAQIIQAIDIASEQNKSLFIKKIKQIIKFQKDAVH